MKNLFTSITASTLALTFLGGLVSFNKSNSNNNNDLPVGTVIYSIIPPTQFLQANKGWAKLDGNTIDQNSELFHMMQETGILSHLNGKLPNGSGMFIRNMNYNSDGIDPDKSRSVGLSQPDVLKSHSHPHSHALSISGTTSTNSHSHGYNDQYLDLNWKNLSWTSTACDCGGNGWSYSLIDNENSKYQSNSKLTSFESHSHSFSWSGNTSLSNISTGDLETRPVNIALYAYIKIN